MHTTIHTFYIGMAIYTYREPNMVVLCHKSHSIETDTLPFEGDYLNCWSCLNLFLVLILWGIKKKKKRMLRHRDSMQSLWCGWENSPLPQPSRFCCRAMQTWLETTDLDKKVTREFRLESWCCLIDFQNQYWCFWAVLLKCIWDWQLRNQYAERYQCSNLSW